MNSVLRWSRCQSSPPAISILPLSPNLCYPSSGTSREFSAMRPIQKPSNRSLCRQASSRSYGPKLCARKNANKSIKPRSCFGDSINRLSASLPVCLYALYPMPVSPLARLLQ